MPILAKEIIFSDGAHFDLGGYIDKQNCRIWGAENLRAYIEKPAHPKEFWFKKIEKEDISNIWFQQDGSTCHTAEATPHVLRF